MVSIISSNSSSLLKTEDVSLDPNLTDNSYYSTLDGLPIEEDFLIEPLPSLYFSELKEDTEDDDEDNLPKHDKTPPVSKKAPLSSDSPPIEAFSYSRSSVNYSLSAASSSSCAAQNPTFMSYSKPPQPSSSTFIKMDACSSPQPSQSSSRFMNALQRLRPVNKHPHPTSVSPVDLKVVPSKSSLADKIKSKLLEKRSSLVEVSCSISMHRSSSLSNWSSRLASKRQTQQVSSKDSSNTLPFSITKSISSHRLYNKQQRLAGRSRQPSRAANTVRSAKTQQGVRFTKLVSVKETFSKLDYDRASDTEAVCTRLTPAIAQQIKEELNAYKLYEMKVHESSRINTHFFT